MNAPFAFPVRLTRRIKLTLVHPPEFAAHAASRLGKSSPKDNSRPVCGNSTSRWIGQAANPLHCLGTMGR